MLPKALFAATSLRPLKMPPLIDATETKQFSLLAQSGTQNFLGKSESVTWGFNQNFLGPTLRVAHQGETQAEVFNGLTEKISVHWHGLVAPGDVEGGPHLVIRAGDTWQPALPVDQPAATIWYHSHIHGETGRHVNNGLAGVIQLADGLDQERGLPNTYGVDDLTLILQDRRFDEGGRMQYAPSMHDRMMGFLGNTMLINGQSGATAVVPKGIVRLRLLNGSNARIYGLKLSDGRPFHLIGTDSGLIDRTIELQFLTIAPGERYEVLVDFGSGEEVSLVSEQTLTADLSAGSSPFEVLPFAIDTTVQAAISKIPEQLGGSLPNLVQEGANRRHIGLEMGMGPMAMMNLSGNPHSINGAHFDMSRIDQEVRQGKLEHWTVTANMQLHPFHVHGVMFQVLAENGARPRAQNLGWKDTVLINGQAEILMRFDQAASRDFPFMYHCHILEHEDGGMMGQFTVSS